MCFTLPEKRICAHALKLNAIRAGTRVRARICIDMRACSRARGTHAEYVSACVCRVRGADSAPMAHCLSHQFPRFMRGFNEVIGLAGAINILIAPLTIALLPARRRSPSRLIVARSRLIMSVTRAR